jgi:hypothetical protein
MSASLEMAREQAQLYEMCLREINQMSVEHAPEQETSILRNDVSAQVPKVVLTVKDVFEGTNWYRQQKQRGNLARIS